MVSHIDHVSARLHVFLHGWMLDSWKIITLFVFAKIDIYFSQNTDGIGIINASAAYCEAGVASRQRILQPSLNSYVQDFMIYLTNTAWWGEKLAKGCHVRDT